ncbi:MAG: YdcF family protein [Niastella sp.]|nr:YdcF family protein [Niastella sp.]
MKPLILAPMFFIFSKIFSFLFAPFNWMLILLITAVFIKNKGWKKKLFHLCVVCFLIFSNPFIIHQFNLQWQEPFKELATNENFETGIVLAGFISFDKKNGDAYFGSASDRFIQALRLYKTGHIKKIMITGGSGSLFHQEFKEADYVKNVLLQMGVPGPDIITENLSRNTFENAMYSKKILDSMQLHGPYLLITSAMHMKRAEAVFKKAGYSVRPYPCNYYDLPHGQSFLDAMIPSAGAIDAWEKLMREWVGYCVYRITGKA